MDPTITFLLGYIQYVRTRLSIVRQDERGYSTEAVLLTALLAALALAVGVIITTKITGKANSIPTDPAGS
jgi:hypothetical protein